MSAADQAAQLVSKLSGIVRDAGGDNDTFQTIHVSVHAEHHLAAALREVSEFFDDGSENEQPAITYAIGPIGGYHNQKVMMSAVAAVASLETDFGDLPLTAESIQSVIISGPEKAVLTLAVANYQKLCPNRTCTLRLFVLHVAGRVGDTLEGEQRFILDGLARHHGIMMYN